MYRNNVKKNVAQVMRRIAARRVGRLSSQSSLVPVAIGGVSSPFAATSSVRSFSTQSKEFSGGEKFVGVVDMMNEVAKIQQAQVAKLVPWFVENMPNAYFREVPEDLRMKHLLAVSSIEGGLNDDINLNLQSKRSSGESIVTKITTSTKSGSLRAQMFGLEVPDNHTLDKVTVYTTVDNKLALNMFYFIPRGSTSLELGVTPDQSQHIKECVQSLKAGAFSNDSSVAAYSEETFGAAAMDDFFGAISESYVQYMATDLRRLLKHIELYRRVKDTELCAVDVTKTEYELHGETEGFYWIDFASGNTLPEVQLRLASSILHARNITIEDARLDTISGKVSMLQVLVHDIEGKMASEKFQEVLKKELKRSKWIDRKTIDVGLWRQPGLGIGRAEVITAYAGLLHGPLYRLDNQQFSSINGVLDTMMTKPLHVNIAKETAELFLDKFNPNKKITEEELNNRENDLQARISELNNSGPRLALSRFVDAVHKTLRTNYYKEERFALSLRIDPTVMITPGDEKPVVPYGTFFVHGRHFNAFHNRFRDIARGGLRLVTPVNADQTAFESARQFDEVYGLSYAQQLKNKDIPEGGAKGVILVDTASMRNAADRPYALRKAVRSFTDAMLDLIVKDSVADLVDYLKKDELIYFGPDEQIINEDIVWITQRAQERGYPIPAAFMSSKPDAGFNHKEFGVTSEGVVVCLDVALRRSLGIDPHKDKFTLKVTGGPDGDVAGNLLKFCFRDYGDNCKVVGIADGFGVAEDVDGLDSTELLRLVHEGLPITSFRKECLGPNGIMVVADDEEGILRRNSMWSRVKSDAFVPAGGRPATINIENWHKFLDEDGNPSSPLIVEGANIFTTPEARLKLFEEGNVAIVKDSSANKCGVITSSCEIAASMLLTKKEFLDNKKELVESVLVNLRELARLEAELMFRTYSNYPGNLPHFSERISQAINDVTDAVTDSLENVNPDDELFKELLPLVIDSQPSKLKELAGDRISSSFPVQYQRNAMASALASKLVYNEGIHLVESQPKDKIAERAIEYYRAEKKMREVVASLEEAEGLSPDVKELTLNTVKKGGARSLLGFF